MDKINVNNEEITSWNIQSIINFIKQNYIQLLLLLLVFFIIYIVDYIHNINNMLFNMPSFPGFPEQKKVKGTK